MQRQVAELDNFMNDNILFISFVCLLLSYFNNSFPLNPLRCYCQLDTSYWQLALDFSELKPEWNTNKETQELPRHCAMRG